MTAVRVLFSVKQGCHGAGYDGRGSGQSRDVYIPPGERARFITLIFSRWPLVLIVP
jgi:hypothetical protein